MKYAPDVVIRRLPKYYSQLIDLQQEGVERISSLQLSKRMGLNASQIRQDLNYFGGFGQQGYGYLVDNLKESIEQILGLHENRKLVLVGCGNMGKALASYRGFYDSGFSIVAMFDADPNTIGTQLNGKTVQDVAELESYCKNNPIDIGIICTPKKVATGIANIFDEAGIKGIWNFAPVDLELKNAEVEDVRLSDSLFVLNYKMNHGIFD